MGLFSSIYGLVAAGADKRAENQIHPEYHSYETSPYAKNQLGIAEQLFNGRMPGAADEERNIASAQSNFSNNVNRNATDSSQALALGGLGLAESNKAYNQLGTQEAGYKSSMLNNLNAGYQAMVGEGDKVYQDQLNKYNTDEQLKLYFRNAARQNTANAFNGFDSMLGMGAGNMKEEGKGGAFSSLLGFLV